MKKNKVVSAVSEVKQRSERSRRFHYNSSEVNSVLGVVIEFILIVVIVMHHSWRSKIFNFSSSEVKQRGEHS